MTSGRVSDSSSLLPLRSCAWSGEALAAELRLVELVALDHRAHRAVEDQDAAGEGLAQGLLGGPDERGRAAGCGWTGNGATSGRGRGGSTSGRGRAGSTGGHGRAGSRATSGRGRTERDRVDERSGASGDSVAERRAVKGHGNPKKEGRCTGGTRAPEGLPPRLSEATERRTGRCPAPGRDRRRRRATMRNYSRAAGCAAASGR